MGVQSLTPSTAEPTNGATLDHPADARRVYDWEVDDNGHAERFFHGARHEHAGIAVAIAGIQTIDGTVRRHAIVSADYAEMTADELRQLATLALNAANEIDADGAKTAAA